MAEKSGILWKFSRKLPKLIIALAVIASIIICTWLILRKLSGSEEETTKHVQIEFVQKAIFVERITELGDLEALEEVEIKSDVAGVIKELYVDDGEHVEGCVRRLGARTEQCLGRTGGHQRPTDRSRGHRHDQPAEHLAAAEVAARVRERAALAAIWVAAG